MISANGYMPESFTVRNNQIVRESYKKKPELMALTGWDLCLYNDQQDWERLISMGGLHTLCCPAGRPKYSQKPWVAMPKEGRRFKPIGITQVSDLVVDTPTVVLSQLVPIGYDGVITDIVCEVVGPGGATGFVDGSGDLVWRLSANGRYLRDLGNIKVTLGSLVTPSPVPRSGLIVHSHDKLEFSATMNLAGSGNLNPLARVVCSITGWWYPR